METIVIDNQAFTLSALTLGDLKAFRVWFQYLDWLNFQELKGTLPDDEFYAESQRIRIECTRNKTLEGDLTVADMMDKAEGIVKLCQLSLHHNQPNLSYTDVALLLRKPESVLLVERMLILSGLAPSGWSFNNADTSQKKSEEEVKEQGLA